MNAITKIEAELAEEVGAFFAPVSSDVIDGLIGEYQHARRRISEVAAVVNGAYGDVMHYFVKGNADQSRGRVQLRKGCEQLFGEAGAVAALNSAFWQRALNLTDVLEIMPQKRRSEWHEQISSFACPDFEEGTVRATIMELLNMRAQFLAERVDGIFRGLSGEHVTNSPEGFGKRMIIANVLTAWGSSNHDKTGLIADLRCVIAMFMGRDEPRYSVTGRLIETLRSRWGEWVTIDGGALRIRLYKKGTAHMEVHPDMAWRLNMVLAHLYPAAIPAKFRQRPARKPKSVELLKRPLPFRVLEVLGTAKEARRRVSEWPERWETIPNAVMVSGLYGASPHVAAEVGDVLRALGGTPGDRCYTWHFDYCPLDVINEVVGSGCLPDQRSHQFYPTPAGLAGRVVDLAEIGPTHTCLEPSAGTGGLADFMPKDRTFCVEVSDLHCKVLEAKGYALHRGDFLTFNPALQFDRVIMNPPFDQGRWRAHLEHAASMVAPGGRLVAILPSGAKGVELPGFSSVWHGPLSGQFPGVSVDVVILVADRVAL